MQILISIAIKAAGADLLLQRTSLSLSFVNLTRHSPNCERAREAAFSAGGEFSVILYKNKSQLCAEWKRYTRALRAKQKPDKQSGPRARDTIGFLLSALFHG